jgi:hypothetical protein
MGKIVKRGDLIGMNGFCRLFGLTRKEVERIVNRGQVDGILIPDGSVDRVFIDLGAILKEAKAENVPPSSLVRRYCRQSKR